MMKRTCRHIFLGSITDSVGNQDAIKAEIYRIT